MNGTPYISRPGTYTTLYNSSKVPGKKEVVVDTVPWTPTEKEWQDLLSPEVTDSVAGSDSALLPDSSTGSSEPATLATITPKSVAPKAAGFGDMPSILVAIIGGQLSDPGSLAQSDKFAHQAILQMHRSRLKPEHRVGNPTLSYADPKKRLDQFVPLDANGLAYLSKRRITHQYLINQIKKGVPEGMSIEQAEKTFRDWRQEIQSAMQGGGHVA